MRWIPAVVILAHNKEKFCAFWTTATRAQRLAGFAVFVLGVSWLSVLALKKRGPQKPGRLVVSYVVRETDMKKLSLFALLAMTATAEGHGGGFAHLTWPD